MAVGIHPKPLLYPPDPENGQERHKKVRGPHDDADDDDEGVSVEGGGVQSDVPGLDHSLHEDQHDEPERQEMEPRHEHSVKVAWRPW